jgi:hypothetical protein
MEGTGTKFCGQCGNPIPNLPSPEKGKVHPTWGLAWGLLWRQGLIMLAIYFVVFIITIFIVYAIGGSIPKVP